MSKCFWLLNHKVTAEQKKELKDFFDVNSIIFPPEEIVNIWASIPPVNNIPDETINEIMDWLNNATSSDVAVVQGESTATFKIVNYLIDKGVLVLAAVSERCSEEKEENGRIVKHSFFKHVCFRKYER